MCENDEVSLRLQSLFQKVTKTETYKLLGIFTMIPGANQMQQYSAAYAQVTELLIFFSVSLIPNFTIYISQDFGAAIFT